jgi:hypothetical protein
VKILAEHIIPEVIRIRLVRYDPPESFKGEKSWMSVPHWEVHWWMWRPYKVPPTGEAGWGGLNWSHATDLKLEAEQWYDIAIARVSSWIITGNGVAIDIMHDHKEMDGRQA